MALEQNKIVDYALFNVHAIVCRIKIQTFISKDLFNTKIMLSSI